MDPFDVCWFSGPKWNILISKRTGWIGRSLFAFRLVSKHSTHVITEAGAAVVYSLTCLITLSASRQLETAIKIYSCLLYRAEVNVISRSKPLFVGKRFFFYFFCSCVFQMNNNKTIWFCIYCHSPETIRLSKLIT